MRSTKRGRSCSDALDPNESVSKYPQFIRQHFEIYCWSTYTTAAYVSRQYT